MMHTLDSPGPLPGWTSWSAALMPAVCELQARPGATSVTSKGSQMPRGGPDPAPHALVDHLALTLDGRDRHSPGRPAAGIGEQRPRDSRRCRHQSRGEDSVVAGLCDSASCSHVFLRLPSRSLFGRRPGSGRRTPLLFARIRRAVTGTAGARPSALPAARPHARPQRRVVHVAPRVRPRADRA